MRWFEKILVVAAVLVVSSCDWTAFDDLAQRAPVQAAEPPGGLDVFGRSVIPMDGYDASHGGRSNLLVLAGSGTEAVVRLSMDGDGAFSLKSGGEPDPSLDKEPGSVTALAQIRSTDADASAVLVAMASKGLVYSVTIPKKGGPVPVIGGLINWTDGSWEMFGQALAVTDMDGDGKDDWAVVSSQSIYVFPDADDGVSNSRVLHCDASHQCATDCGAYLGDRPVAAIGNLLGDLSRPTLAVGLPDDTGGRVVLMSWSGSGSLPTGDCRDATDLVRVTVEAPNDAGSFGMALAVYDVDGDGRDELFVGAPDQSRVYVYQGTSDATGWQMALVATIAPSAGDAVAFGSAIALVDLDGDGAPELAVGDSQAPEGGKVGAGRVHLFRLTSQGGIAAEELGVVADMHPQTRGHFGKGLGAIVAQSVQHWVPGTAGVAQELVIVSDKQVYAFLKTGIDGDVRP